MPIHILDCAPMSPWLPRWQVGGVCLLVEADQGPVLVDTGLGLHDHTNPSGLVRFFGLLLGIQHDPESTAVRQVARLGYAPEEVQHIVMTHLHFDHAGGLPDFPRAQVHVHRGAYEAMLRPHSWLELAHDRSDFAHNPSWILYDQPDALWFGLDAIRLPFTPEMYLVPLFGHTRGHCGVAVQDGKGWLFQCADALPLGAEFDMVPAWISQAVLGPHVSRLKAWAALHPEVRLLAGHMMKSFFEQEQQMGDGMM
jgi:glyoxylase-like metal-dependent hydrolase (beta-lactamase superfamily II)